MPGTRMGAVGARPPQAAPFSPADISGLEWWIDASESGDFTYSSGTLVSQWNDRSGNGRHLTQADTGAQPTRSGTQNGLDTVIFSRTGTADYMDTASFTVSQPLTAIVATDYTDGATLSSVAGSLQLGYGNGAVFQYFAGSSQIGMTGTATGVHVVSWVINGASSASWRDGVANATGNPGASGTTSGLRIAERNLVTASSFQGEVFEMVVYSGALSTGDRQTVEDYLQAKWATP